jgi:alkylated DNA repair dioxygenase AlkB
MQFTRKSDRKEVYRVVLPRRSMLVMTGECRDEYLHSISKDEEETGVLGGRVVDVVRGRRVSLTFRRINVE